MGMLLLLIDVAIGLVKRWVVQIHTCVLQEMHILVQLHLLSWLPTVRFDLTASTVLRAIKAQLDLRLLGPNYGVLS